MPAPIERYIKPNGISRRDGTYDIVRNQRHHGRETFP